MIKIPILVRCPNCNKVFNKGRKQKIRIWCPHCNKYSYIWEVEEFFRAKRSGYEISNELLVVDYETLKDKIEMVKKRNT